MAFAKNCPTNSICPYSQFAFIDETDKKKISGDVNQNYRFLTICFCHFSTPTLTSLQQLIESICVKYSNSRPGVEEEQPGDVIPSSPANFRTKEWVCIGT